MQGMRMEPQERISEPDETQHIIAQPDRRIGAILAADGKLDVRDIKRVLELQDSRGLRFGEAAVRLGLIGVDDLRRALAKQYNLPPHRAAADKQLSSELVVAYEPFHACAEQMRALRTQILMRWTSGGAHRKLAIVSPGPREGRSYVAANLAVAFSQLGKRTLLIDADLRKPRQQRIFDVPDRVGLSAVLSGRADRRAVVPIDEFGPLSLLPAGAPPPNPVELLSHDTFPALLRNLETEFDVILFDTPAARMRADAQTVAYHAGSVLMLARKDYTRLSDATRMARELSDTGAQPLGIVCNAF